MRVTINTQPKADDDNMEDKFNSPFAFLLAIILVAMYGIGITLFFSYTVPFILF